MNIDTDTVVFNEKGSEALQNARNWYESPQAYRTTMDFEERYSNLPRLLFQELSLAQSSVDQPSVFEAAPGQGLGLKSLREKTGPERLTIHNNNWRLPSVQKAMAGKHFDLILVYSVIRLLVNPEIFLQQFAHHLRPGGRVCLVDFVGGIEADLRDHIANCIEKSDHRRYLIDQLAVAPYVEEVQQWLSSAGIQRYRLAVGGLGGYHENSQEAMTMISSHPGIMPLLRKLSESGFRSRRAADLVFHLTFTCNEVH